MFKLKLIFILLFIALIVGGISIPLFIKETVAFTIPRINKTITIEPTDTANLKKDTAEQISTLSSRAQVLGDNTSKILDTAIQADTASDSSMANRAVEYGKYLYCKQVVTSYENTINSEN